MKNISFYNTVNESGEMLKSSRRKAMTQEDDIMQFCTILSFACNWTPSDIWREVLPNAPLTSVRRAMSTLTAKGLLEKTDIMRMGGYGKLEHAWRLPVQVDPRQGEIF